MIHSKKRFFLLWALGLCLLALGIGAASAQQDEQVVASTDLNLSVHVPSGWVFGTINGAPYYTSVLVFADNPTTLQDSIDYFNTSVGRPIQGVFGLATIVSPSVWSSVSTNPQLAIQGLLQAVSGSLQITQQFTSTISGYSTVVLEITDPGINAHGYVGAFTDGADIVLFTIVAGPTSDFSIYQSLIQLIGGSLSFPAEPGAITQPALPTQSVVVMPTAARTPEPLPTQEALPTREVLPTQEVLPTIEAVPTEAHVSLSQVIAQNNALSLMLPLGWSFLDHSADNQVVAFGDSGDAALSRLASVRPDLVTNPVAMTGLGGVVVLYPVASLGLSPENPDVLALITQVVGNLSDQGYDIVVTPQPITVGGSSGMIAVVRGGEYGFLALVPFGDTIAYITATGTADTFEANQNLLREIIDSVNVPAFIPTPVPTLPGLGGLQALPTATVMPTATATPRGLGGLGIFGRPEATPESTIESTVEATASAEGTIEATVEVTETRAEPPATTPDATS